MDDPVALEKELRTAVERNGACTRPWTLRISSAPKGQIIVALWDGTDLETRWASNRAEAPTVAGLLVRTVVERSPEPSPSAARSSSPGPDAGGAPPASSGAPPPDPAASALVPAPAGARFSIGLSVGPAWSAKAGWGGEGTLLLLYGTSVLRGGLTARGAFASRSPGDRSEAAFAATGLLGGALTGALAGGIEAEVGVALQRAHGAAPGATAGEGGAGLAVSAGPFLRYDISRAVGLFVAIPVRYATTSASPLAAPTPPGSKPNNPGKGQGQEKAEAAAAAEYAANSARAAASSDAVSRLGGAVVALDVGAFVTF